jgi:polyhydroxyalkanoate synthesis regulator phasin
MTPHRNWFTERKQRWQYQTVDRITDDEIDLLADAILKQIKWRQETMQLKQERKIKRMIKQLRLRRNRESRLPD